MVGQDYPRRIIMDKQILDIKDLYEGLKNNNLHEQEVTVNGWIRTNRNNGHVGFIELHDGTCFKGVQLVYSEGNDFGTYSHLHTGASIEATGKLVLTPNMPQPFEIHVTTITLIGDCPEDYPLQKKRASFEFLRDNAHLRPRANTFQAVFRVRNVLAMAVHTYFQSHGFIYVHTPEITGNDAEGAGQVFNVTTGPKNDPTDFFGKKASLTVSGQLHVEAFMEAFKKVYTFGPTFRAEKSNTPRHASEFWMIEPEVAFIHLKEDMELIEDCLKYCIKYVLEHCPDEMNFFDKFIQPGLKQKLTDVVNASFKVMKYEEALGILKKAYEDGHHFDNHDFVWGMDFQSEHERYLTEVVVNGPMFLIDFPKEIKAFYMKENEDGRTVAGCDLLVPGEGEIVGGSEREVRYDVLKAKMDKIGNTQGLEWYLNLRKYGSVPHAGFGIGFDRLLMYVTGIQNIRDVQPYPRTSNQLKY